MDEFERQRYARHLQLPELGPAAQSRLTRARVLVVGCGGLGSPVLLYLAAAGVGELTICDFDHIELSNLQRQIAFATEDVGDDKVEAAARAIGRLNPHVSVRPIGWAIDGDELRAEGERAQVVVDASDNFETRFALNQVCVDTGTALVSAAAVRWEGHLFVTDPNLADAPCYRCLYEEDGDPDEPCALVGVFAPLLGVMGSLQASETLKLLTGVPQGAAGRLLRFDALATRWRESRVRRDPACPVCSA